MICMSSVSLNLSGSDSSPAYGKSVIFADLITVLSLPELGPRRQGDIGTLSTVLGVDLFLIISLSVTVSISSSSRISLLLHIFQPLDLLIALSALLSMMIILMLRKSQASNDVDLSLSVLAD